MTLFMALALVIAYCIYMLVCFNYAAYVFSNEKKRPKFYLIVIPLNLIIFSLFYLILDANFEFVFMFIFFVVHTLELAFLCERGSLILLFGAISITLHLFSRRIIVATIFALANNMSLAATMNDPVFMFWITIIPIVLATPYIILTRRFLVKDLLDLIFSDQKNVAFSVGILSLFLTFLVASLSMIDIGMDSTNHTVFLLVIGVLCSLGYHVALLLSYIFSKLKLHVVKFEAIKRDVLEEQEKLEEIEIKATTDAFTGFRVRSVAEERAKHYIDQSIPFYCIVFDMDHLKHVNDTYGHAEGDFYIKAVARILNDSFAGDIISRMGGDEFLVIGRGNDAYLPIQKGLKVYQNVAAIQRTYSKPYSTSISYGIVHVPHSNTRSVDEIISEADQRMYSFKRVKRRER